MGIFKHDSKGRLDRLAMHLGLTSRLLKSGTVGGGMREQLRIMRQAIDDVLKDDELADSAWVQHEAQVSSQVA
jgi:hypothetical protein